MEDLQIMGNAMAVDTVKARMPQQSVHAGRGVAGYRGNVEVYDPQTGKTVATPKSVKRISGTKAKDGPGEDK